MVRMVIVVRIIPPALAANKKMLVNAQHRIARAAATVESRVARAIATLVVRRKRTRFKRSERVSGRDSSKHLYI